MNKAFFVQVLSLFALSAPTGAGLVSVSARQSVVPGISVLLEDSLDLIRGKRVGLITNHTARDERGRSSIDLIHDAPDVTLAALFAPEHGIRGSARGGARIATSVDETTGVKIYSLYGDTKVPAAKMLDGIDVLVYDIQDVGARMYTYVWTMTLAAEAAKKAGKKFIVLDRPNPIRADIVEGGSIEKRYRSFTGLHDVPLRYGLTPGELARYLVATGQIDADITVVPLQNYERVMWWPDTGLAWLPPSPNIGDLEAALLYPGMSFFEATNLSEGRGTDEPFRLVGARWLRDAAAITNAMNAKQLEGVRFEAVKRRIGKGEKFGGDVIPMVHVIVTYPSRVRSSEIAAHLLREIYVRHKKEFRWQAGSGIEELSGSRALRVAVQTGGVGKLIDQWRTESQAFVNKSAPYLLY
ncbi:MAG: exo-beta-N-acetylmuramidase NamZ domain-containing protein [Gemmatimonas sp.]